MRDAVVIGAGPNGLVAANLLADAGWEVEVLEAEDEPDGAVKTAELTEPGFRHDTSAGRKRAPHRPHGRCAAERILRPAALLPGAVDDVRRFEWDHGTVKINWALDGRIPWAAPDAARAPVVHVVEGFDALALQASQLAHRFIPATPFLVLGQYAAADPSRCPPGKEVAWAYTHVPQDVRGDIGRRRPRRTGCDRRAGRAPRGPRAPRSARPRRNRRRRCGRAPGAVASRLRGDPG